jgi:hypothetical protein
MYRATKPLELVHVNVCGPITPPTPGGKSSFLMLGDDMSRYMWLILIAAKGEATDAIKRVQARAEAECGERLCVLRTDRDGEFTSNNFSKYCSELGIKRHLTADGALLAPIEWGC